MPALYRGDVLNAIDTLTLREGDDAATREAIASELMTDIVGVSNLLAPAVRDGSVEEVRARRSFRLTRAGSMELADWRNA